MFRLNELQPLLRINIKLVSRFRQSSNEAFFDEVNGKISRADA